MSFMKHSMFRGRSDELALMSFFSFSHSWWSRSRALGLSLTLSLYLVLKASQKCSTNASSKLSPPRYGSKAVAKTWQMTQMTDLILKKNMFSDQKKWEKTHFEFAFVESSDWDLKWWVSHVYKNYISWLFFWSRKILFVNPISQSHCWWPMYVLASIWVLIYNEKMHHFRNIWEPAVVSLMRRKQFSPAIWLASRTERRSASVKKLGTCGATNQKSMQFLEVLVELMGALNVFVTHRDDAIHHRFL